MPLRAVWPTVVPAKFRGRLAGWRFHASAGVANLGGKVQLREIIRLQAQLFCRIARSRIPVAQVIEVCAAGGIHKTGRKERIRAGLISACIQRNAYVDERAIRNGELLILVDAAGIPLVVVPDLVVADVGLGKDAKIHAEFIKE